MKKLILGTILLLSCSRLMLASSYSLTQLTPETVERYMASNPVFFLKSDWIGGCGGADSTYLALKSAIGDRAGIPFAVANWGDHGVFSKLDIADPGLNYFIHIGGRTYAWTGPRVYWSVYAWARDILARHNKAGRVPVQGRLRSVPDSTGSILLDDGLSNLYSFDKASTKNLVPKGADFNTLNWSRYLRNNSLDIYHEYMLDEGETRVEGFTSGLGFWNDNINYEKGFSVSFDFKPHTTKEECRLLFKVGVTPMIAIQSFKGTNYLAIETDRAEYGTILPDLKFTPNQWNSITLSFDPGSGLTRIILNGDRLQDIVMPCGLSGKSVGVEAEATPDKYSASMFSFVYGRGGDIFTGLVDNLAFWTRPLNGAEVNQANAWVRTRTRGTNEPDGSSDSVDLPPRRQP